MGVSLDDISEGIQREELPQAQVIDSARELLLAEARGGVKEGARRTRHSQALNN
jgi:hypothetical protein